MDNTTLLTQFYTAFKNKDYSGMKKCYHNDIVFEDPAFGVLKAERVSYMWEMLCQNGKDLTLEFSNIEANETSAKAHWEAKYTFSATGRKVHNSIEANFEFKDGLIIKHTDNFNFSSWAKQALGIVGVVFGKTTFFQNIFQKQANSLLDKHISKHHGK